MNTTINVLVILGFAFLVCAFGLGFYAFLASPLWPLAIKLLASGIVTIAAGCTLHSYKEHVAGLNSTPKKETR